MKYKKIILFLKGSDYCSNPTPTYWLMLCWGLAVVLWNDRCQSWILFIPVMFGALRVDFTPCGGDFTEVVHTLLAWILGSPHSGGINGCVCVGGGGLHARVDPRNVLSTRPAGGLDSGMSHACRVQGDKCNDDEPWLVWPHSSSIVTDPWRTCRVPAPAAARCAVSQQKLLIMI